MSERLLENRVALVTGASRGIGAAVARRLASEGAHVILAARTVGGLEVVDDSIRKLGGKASLMPVDLNDLDKIDAIGPRIAELFGRLDIIVGNAGVLGDLTPLGHADAKMWRKVMTVNLDANWRLIRTCDPILRMSDAGRALFVTSGVTASMMPFWGPYTVSKVALEALVKTYAAEVEDTPIKVNLINPGEVRTAMHAAAMPGIDPLTLPSPDSITQTFLDLALPSCKTHGEVVHV